MKKHVQDKQRSNARPDTSGKKLAFDKQTLRTLNAKTLGSVVGGIPSSKSCDDDCY